MPLFSLLKKSNERNKLHMQTLPSLPLFPAPENDLSVSLANLPTGLVCVRVVCREKNLLGIHHVQDAINGYLKPLLRYTVVRLCKLGLPILLQQVIDESAQEPTNSVKNNPRFRQWQFDEGLTAAGVAGNMEIAKVLVLSFPDCTPSQDVTNTAAGHGHLELLKLMFTHESENPDVSESVAAALSAGHLNVAKWLQTRGTCSTSRWVSAAAQSGNLEIVKWTYAQSGREDKMEKAAKMAASHGHQAVLAWLIERVEGRVNLNEASSRGHFHVVEWMLLNHLNKCDGLHNLTRHAARDDRLDVLRRLHDMMSGSTPTAKYLNTNARFTTDAMDAAATYGRLEVIKWLHANRTEGCTVEAMDRAAVLGHLDVVKWLHTNRREGCSPRAVYDSKHLDVVMWLLEHRSKGLEGCRTNAMVLAARNGRLDLVQYIDRSTSWGCTVEAMNDAAMNGHLNVVKWLHSNRSEGCTTRAMELAAMKGHLKVVQWLHTNRQEGCTVKAMYEAATQGHLEVVKWLHENRTEGCTSDAVGSAIHFGHCDVALFLLTERPEPDVLATLQNWPETYAWTFTAWLYAHHPPEFVSTLMRKLLSSFWQD